MNTSKLKNFAQNARRLLMQQVGLRLEAALVMQGAEAAENRKGIEDLKKAILESSKDAVIERVAYIWFNRFSALRFMDANNYSFVRVLSPVEGDSQPEILAEAKQGHFPEELAQFVKKQRVSDLLTGTLQSRDGQGEAYRLLLVGVCNYYERVMPFLFEKIEDYTELLLPLDLLSADSVLSATVEALDEETCQNVEVIGWLYQFYISEKKDAVFAAKQAVSAENIPAATQLFTPNWIVRYLVENSLGRLWMLNHPNSRLVEQMAYYIKPEQQEESFLKIKSPEDLRICDPAVGSGHMLVYAFDLLYAIYEEEGYPPAEIPEKILRHNLYGIEIDERAGALAAFALSMKARQRYSRFFRKPVQTNICVLENVAFGRDELNQYVQAVGKNLFNFKLDLALQQFAEAKHFGSLIRPEIGDVHEVLEALRQKNLSGDLFLFPTHKKVLQLLQQIDYLSAKYHVVIANPPYMGSGAMTAELKEFAKAEYKDSKLDLFSMFIERNLDLAMQRGYVAMITMQSWMFLSSFEALREKLLKNRTILSMAHLGARAFDTIGGEVVQTTAFILQGDHQEDYKGQFLRLVDGRSEAEKQADLHTMKLKPFVASAADFKKIPNSPIAYWVSDSVRNIFSESPSLDSVSVAAVGQNTGDNDRFLRLWYETDAKKINFQCNSREETYSTLYKWYPYNKGGTYRKWYGNFIYLINWKNDAEEIKEYAVERNNGKHWSRYIQNLEWLFVEGLTWTDVTSGNFSSRFLPTGFISDVAGHSAFFSDIDLRIGLSILNSRFTENIAPILNPTIHFQVGNYRNIPYNKQLNRPRTLEIVQELIEFAKSDWDSYETSWDFSSLPLLRENYLRENLAETYDRLRQHWREMTLEMQELEQENNRIFIEAYGLQDELSPDVPLEEITLTCNPAYRYGGKKSEEALEAQLQADTLKEFISYAVGCMFGRYALEKDGLILANQGETLEDYLRRVPNPKFSADRDNAIPILEESWFNDDIVERFKDFLRCTFGDSQYEANLAFIEEALGRDLRSYFVRDFYDEHLRRYNKRPIYWLFSSAKGSFNVLIYMHRYRPDTISVILNDYLREYRKKLEAQIEILKFQSISSNSSKADKTAALKGIEKYQKIVKELDSYERDVLFPLAAQQLEIDLDDGVKVNYQKFGAALKKIAGLESAE